MRVYAAGAWNLGGFQEIQKLSTGLHRALVAAEQVRRL